MLFVLGNRYLASPYYSRDIQTFTIIIDACLFWIALVSFLCAFIDDGDVGIFYLFVGMPFIAMSFILVIHMRESKILTKSLRNFKKDTEFEMFLILLLHLIENRHHSEDRV